MVIVSEGDVGGVACPVPCGVVGPAGRCSWREVEQFGEDGCGDLGGELEQGGASPGEGPDVDEAEAFAQA